MTETTEVTKKNIDVNRGNSHAQIRISETLYTTPAQKTFERNFPTVQGYIYKITYMGRIVAQMNKTFDLVDEYVRQVDEWLEDAEKQISDELGRLITLVEQNGLEEVSVTFTAPIEYEVGIKTPKGRTLLNIFRSFDDVCKLSDKLFLGGVFEEEQTQKLQFTLKRIIEKRCGRIRNAAIKLEKAQKIASDKLNSDDVETLGDDASEQQA